MAYWWVNQNEMFNEERHGGFLWAPTIDKGGRIPHHWARINELRAGDLVFSYVEQSIPAFSVVVSEASTTPRPYPTAAGGGWQSEGRKVDVIFTDVDPPVSLHQILSEVQPLMPAIYSPLNEKGGGNQGYLYPLPPKAARLIIQNIGWDKTIAKVEELLRGDINSNTGIETERQNVILSRIGQGTFRKKLLEFWERKCCASGLPVVELLVASHIKPWCDSSNQERTDKFNGLLLSPAYDAAFDCGLISFEDTGKILISRRLSSADAVILGLKTDSRISGLTRENLRYLTYHRKTILQS